MKTDAKCPENNKTLISVYYHNDLITKIIFRFLTFFLEIIAKSKKKGDFYWIEDRNVLYWKIKWKVITLLFFDYFNNIFVKYMLKSDIFSSLK